MRFSTRRFVPVLLVLQVACGGNPVLPSESMPSGSETGDAPTAGPSVDHGRCVGAVGKEVPAGWLEAGSVVATVAGNSLVKLVLKDSRGEVVATETLAGDRAAGRKAIADAPCKVGGVLLVVPAKEQEGETTMRIYKPEKADEPGDVAQMCTMPSEIDESFDESQRARVAVAIFEQRLTSPRWRAWLADMSAELEATSDESAMTAIKRKRGAELQAVGKRDCWFAAQLAR
jgi:hypothetical protein